MSDTPKLITLQEAAKRLGVKPRRVRQLIQSGQLKAHPWPHTKDKRRQRGVTPQAVARLAAHRRQSK